jgi:hypothetical protein
MRLLTAIVMKFFSALMLLSPVCLNKTKGYISGWSNKFGCNSTYKSWSLNVFLAALGVSLYLINFCKMKF